MARHFRGLETVSTFICTECGAVFTGSLNEAADAAFEHAAAHADEQRQAPHDETDSRRDGELRTELISN